MSIDALFDQLATIYEVNRTKTSSGSQRTLVAKAENVPCHFQDGMGDETRRNDTEEVPMQARIWVPWETNVNEDDIIEVDSIQYGIAFVRKSPLGGHHKTLYVKRIKRDQA